MTEGKRAAGARVTEEMKLVQELDDRQTLVNYLLDELPVEERERFEEQYFLNDELYKRLSAAEDDLIESYLRDELTRRERQKFEGKYFVNSHLLSKVEEAKEMLALIDHTSPHKNRGRRNWWRLLPSPPGGGGSTKGFALATLAVLVTAGAVYWMAMERAALRGRLEQLQASSKTTHEAPSPRVAEQKPSPESSHLETRAEPPGLPAAPVKHSLPPPVAVRKPPRAAAGRPGGATGAGRGSLIVTYKFPREDVVTLNARGRGPDPLVIASGTKLVRLRTFVEDNLNKEYEVSLQEAGGGEVLKQVVTNDKIGPGGQWLVVDFPAAIFTSKDYFFKVTSSTPEGNEVLAYRLLTVINHSHTRD